MATRTARLALGLWIIWAVIVWNVVFDHVIVVAGREYVRAAVVATTHGSPYAREDDWMRPALPRAFWSATAAAAAILVVGVLALQLAIRQPHGLSRRPEGLPS